MLDAFVVELAPLHRDGTNLMTDVARYGVTTEIGTSPEGSTDLDCRIEDTPRETGAAAGVAGKDADVQLLLLRLPPTLRHFRAFSAKLARLRVVGFLLRLSRRSVETGIFLPFLVPVCFRSAPFLSFSFMGLRRLAISAASCGCAHASSFSPASAACP